MQPRGLEMIGMLLPLGIEKGKEFEPEPKTAALLKKASAEAHAWLMNQATTDVTPWWPGSQWVDPTLPITLPTEFKWEMPNYFGVDARAIALSQYFCPTAKLGTAVSTSAHSTTATADLWRAGALTGCAFRRMSQCASFGLSPSTV